MMIEQPLAHDDIFDHAKLQKQIKTPICLDESIRTREDAEHAITLGSCRIVNLKLGRVGGHWQAKTGRARLQRENMCRFGVAACSNPESAVLITSRWLRLKDLLCRETFRPATDTGTKTLSSRRLPYLQDAEQ